MNPDPLARAGRNLAFKGIGEALGRLCFVLIFILAARLLGAHEYGRFSFALSLAGLAFIGMDLGLNTLLVRDGARDHALVPGYAGTMLLIKLVLTGVVLSGLLAYCLVRAYPGEETALVMALAGVLVLWGLWEFGVAGFNALERMDLEALTKTLARVVALAAAGGLLLAGWGLWGLVAGLALANILAAGSALLLLRRMAGYALCLQRSFLVYLAREAMPLALTGVFILIYTRVDVVMLEILGRSYREIGWYAAAVRISDTVSAVPALVAAALLPVLSQLSQSDREAMALLYRQGMRLLLLLGLPAAVGLFAVAPQAALLIFGPHFSETGQALWWLAPKLVFLFVNFLQLTLLTALGRQRLAALATGACLFINVALNWWWIPLHGFLGAAAATLVTEGVLLALCGSLLARLEGIGFPWGRFLRTALAAGVMGGALWFIGQERLPVVIIFGVVTYICAAAVLKVLNREEINALWEIIRSKARVREGGGA